MRDRGKELIKRILRPARTAAGKFVISTRQEAQLAAMTQRMEQWIESYEMHNSLMFKAAAFVAVDKIEGDYLEFGVYRGNSFVKAFKALQEAFRDTSTLNEWNTERDCIERRDLWAKMRFFAFDSFQGLPELTGIDALSRDFFAGKWSCSVDDFKKNVALGGGCL